MVKKTNNLWNTSDVCEYYGVTRQTVSNWVKKGCPVYKLGPKTLKFDNELLLEWVISGKGKFNN